MTYKFDKQNVTTIAGTEYFAVKRSGASRKQLRVVAANNKPRALHATKVIQAKVREAKTRIKDYVPEPQYQTAPNPVTLMRVVPKQSVGSRKFESWLKRELPDKAATGTYN